MHALTPITEDYCHLRLLDQAMSGLGVHFLVCLVQCCSCNTGRTTASSCACSSPAFPSGLQTTCLRAGCPSHPANTQATWQMKEGDAQTHAVQIVWPALINVRYYNRSCLCSLFSQSLFVSWDGTDSTTDFIWFMMCVLQTYG